MRMKKTHRGQKIQRIVNSQNTLTHPLHLLNPLHHLKPLNLLNNSRGISILFLIVAMLLMVAIGYVFSYLTPTKQKSAIFPVYSNQAFFIAQSGVEFAVRYASDNSWTTPVLLTNLNGITRNLGNGQFTLIYDSSTNRLTSRGDIQNISQRQISVSNFTQFVSSGALIIDPDRPVPCQTTRTIEKRTVTVVNFFIKNVSASSITLNAFESTWIQNPPTRQLERIYLGGILKFNGNYPSGSAPQPFTEPPPIYTINSGESILISVWFTRIVNNLRSMIIIFYSTTGEGYNFNLDPEGNGIPGC